MKPKVIVIAGPTASGKTSLSVEVAKVLNGEIISADSMQIYQEMDIGTAKVTKEEMQGIQHYLIDIIPPSDRFSVSDFQKKAQEAIAQILEKGKVPIIVGGTGLYIEALIYGIEYPDIKINQEYREMLNQIAKTTQGLQELYEKAIQIDAKAMEKISAQDQKRIIRVLEIYHQTGKTKTELERESRRKEVPYEYHLFGLQLDRELLYQRINQRVDKMIKQGLVEEVKRILKRYEQFPTAMQGLGYKEVVWYLKGEISYEEMIEKIKQESRRYAKRQMTWFRKYKEMIWLNALDENQRNIEKIKEEI